MKELTFTDFINLYFGTEFENVNQFVDDMNRGDLNDEYYLDRRKIEVLLKFIVAVDKHI